MIKSLLFLPFTSSLSAPIIINNFNTKPKSIEKNETFIVTSLYQYHSGWIKVGFDDTALIKSIYGQVDKLLRQENVNNISAGSIQISEGNNNFTKIDNYQLIMSDVQTYADSGRVDASKYKNIHLFGDENYSWSWNHFCPYYIWSWQYCDNEGNKTQLYSFNKEGRGNSQITINFSYELTYNLVL